VGFKCLHYSVTESNGHVEITILKKVPGKEFTFGCRTVDDTAEAPKDYKAMDEILTMGRKENEMKVQIPIVDDEQW